MGLFSKAMDYIGLGSGETAAPAASTSSSSNRATARVSPIRRNNYAATSEIRTIDAQSYDDAKNIAEIYRDGVSVVVNIAGLSESDANKMVHFLFGLKSGVDGNIKRITPKVFLITPNSVDVNEPDDTDEQGEDGLVKP
jgi:cell division inhibitor SepF